ncbi:hypothetical protein Aca07nite_76080 [Actinoplanes capillaceus]|uniref:Uncharacterized protein n=1 Tax=Actinoplanes campanulatus TaxID=113559 RepID=A0ABQ3WVW6_9ACTN|nr:hypothetical protein [Actinoplanes capillaceus]GID50333.1 hypothetical protein Aca07nite_76080 [Actinoplanes capillaceus]
MNSAARCAAAVMAAGLLPFVAPSAPAGAVPVAPGAGPPALERMRREVAAATGSRRVPCWRNVTIRSAANGRYVSAEIGWDGAGYGALRARATRVSPWERFTVCRDAYSGATWIRAQANNDFVSAELDYAGATYGLLRAQAQKVAGWERFYSNRPPGGTFSFYARATRRWVSAEVTFRGRGYGSLRARATSVGAEETFRW